MSSLYSDKLKSARERLTALRTLRDETTGGKSGKGSSSRKWQKTKTFVQSSNAAKAPRAPYIADADGSQRDDAGWHRSMLLGGTPPQSPPKGANVPSMQGVQSTPHRGSDLSLPSLTLSPSVDPGDSPMASSQASGQGQSRLSLSSPVGSPMSPESRGAHDASSTAPSSSSSFGRAPVAPTVAAVAPSAPREPESMVARRLEATLALLLESTREQARLRVVIEVLAGPGVGAEAAGLEVSAAESARERALLSELDRAMTECVGWRAQAEEVGARESALKRTVVQLSGVALGVVRGGVGEVPTSPPGDKKGSPEVVNSVEVEVDLGNGCAATVPLTATSDAEAVAAGMVSKHGLHADALVPLTQFIRATIVGIEGPVRRGGSSNNDNNNLHSPRGESRSVRSPRQDDADTTDATEALETTLVDSDNEDDDDHAIHGGGVAPQYHRPSPPPSPTKLNARELMSQLHFERERVRMRELEVESHKAQLAQERARGARMEEEFRARLERTERDMLDKVKAERRRAMEQEHIQQLLQQYQQQPSSVPQQYVVRPHSRQRAPPLHFAAPYTYALGLAPSGSAGAAGPLQGLTEADMRGMHVQASYHPSLPPSPASRATRDVNSPRARAPSPGPSARKQAKERFKKAVSLFDRATDMANDGYLVEAQPIYAEALSIFEALNVPELAKIRQEVQYWADMARRQAQHHAPHAVGADGAAPKASSRPLMPHAPSQAAVPEVSSRPPMPQPPPSTAPFTEGVVASHTSPLVKPRPKPEEAPAPPLVHDSTSLAAQAVPRPPVPMPAAAATSSDPSGPSDSTDDFLKDLEALLDEAGV